MSLDGESVGISNSQFGCVAEWQTRLIQNQVSERVSRFESEYGYMNPEEMAQVFHEAYERLAPNFSYKTREASAVPWEDVPENNKKLMIAVCAEVIKKL